MNVTATNLLSFFLFIGLIFGLLAALMAFLITYNEYSRHYHDNRAPLAASLRTALFAFVVIFAVTAVAGYALTNFVLKK